MTDKKALWDSLGKTDPKHTKGFKRAGGFSGTAIKPQWAIMRLTEEFGPCGVGWGMGEPQFRTVPADGEIMVYCTVSAWHGDENNRLWGVGGDKVLTQRQSGSFADDEAFKKAFTDALMNAFKFIGVGADIHMGLFDDSKYLAEAKESFAPKRDTGPSPVDGKDFWRCEGSGMTAHAAKKEGLDQTHEAMRDEIPQLHTAEAWKKWCSDNLAEINKMPVAWRMVLREEAEERGRELGAIND